MTRKTPASEKSPWAGDVLLKRLEHGIRGSLTSIKGAHEIILAMEDIGEQARGLLQLADHACENLLLTVNGVMDQISLESGEFALDDAGFNLYELTELTVRKMRFAAREQAVSLHLEIDPSIEPMVRGDQERVRQALVNLLGDALVCAGRGGEVAVTLETTRQADLYRFAARIRGKGPSGDAVAAMRLALDRKPGQAAFVPGPALPLCRRVIQAMGGEITVQPQADDAAEVSFTVHLLPARQETGLMAFREHMTHLKALVVDDNFTRRHVLCESLTALGLDFDEAESLGQAEGLFSEAAAGRPYDLAVVARQLLDDPGLDVPRFAAPVPPLIMVVAGGRSGADREREQHAQAATTTLHWPFSLARVSDAIIRSLGLNLSPVAMTGASCPPDPLKILLADGDPVSRTILRSHLRSCSCAADQAGNGLEAFERFAASSYDLVIVETDMPEMNGFEAVRLMRELEEERQQRPTPILAVTTRLSGPRRELALDAGVDALLLKPFSRSKLMRTVNGLLSHREPAVR